MIQATDSSAAEANRDPAVFTVTRSGAPMGDAMTVHFTVTGTATTSDYAAISGSVTIPAGAASATITLTPVDDSAAEGRETVTLTISPSVGNAYSVGSPASATATIADEVLQPPSSTCPTAPGLL